MTLSLNEIEATAKKAARGIGYPWGLAEEAGKAVRWLCSYGLDGCAVLARLLDRFDGTELGDKAPVITTPKWGAKGDVLCPLMTGTALSDRCAGLDDGDYRAGPVAEPSLLVPFAAWSARARHYPVSLAWAECTAVIDDDRLSIDGQPGIFADQVTICRGGTIAVSLDRRGRANPDGSVWEALNKYAHRTYAPATEESRLKGAGGA